MNQNLASLFAGLDLIDVLRDQLGDIAKPCFRWICKGHQMKIGKWHADLIMVRIPTKSPRHSEMISPTVPT